MRFAIPPMRFAIPPENYKGTIGDWTKMLVMLGLWDEKNPDSYLDLMIPSDYYKIILNKCEDENSDIKSEFNSWLLNHKTKEQ